MFRNRMELIKNDCSIDRTVRIILWIIMITICIPYLGAARYAVFKADDFADYNWCLVEEGNSWFSKGLNACISTYMGWQGTWSTNFFRIVCNPLQFFSYRLLRVILIGTVLVSLFSIIFMSRTLLEYFRIGKKNTVYFMAFFLIPLLSYRDYKEIYLWYNGATIYLLPVFFFAVAFFFLLSGEMKKKRVYYILSTIFMVLMTGGVLEFVGFGMFCLLLFIIVDYLRTRKINGAFLAIFGLSLCGALANALAPGNFARKQADGGELEIINSIFMAVEVSFEEAEWLFKDTTFLAFVFATFLFGCHLKKDITGKELAVCSLGSVLLPCITIFPVCLGYGEISADTLPGRCLFLLDAAIISGSIGIVFLAGNKMFIQNILPDVKSLNFMVCMGILLAVISQGQKISEYAPVTIANNLRDGTVHDYASEWRAVFEEIRDREDKNIAIEGGPEETAGCLSPGLRDDPEWWVNKNVAKYFGKESVRIFRKDG